MKKTLIGLISCLTFILFSATVCDNEENYHDIYFENQSDEEVIVVMNVTPASLERFFAFDFWRDTVRSGETHNYYNLYIPQNYIGDEELYVHVMKTSTLANTPIDNIIKKNQYDWLHIYPFAEVQKMNYKVTYTGE